MGGRRGLVVSASDCGEGGPRFESRSRRLFSTNKPNIIRDFTFIFAEPGEDENRSRIDNDCARSQKSMQVR